jgi:hypothetical protein
MLLKSLVLNFETFDSPGRIPPGHCKMSIILFLQLSASFSMREEKFSYLYVSYVSFQIQKTAGGMITSTDPSTGPL